MKVKLIKEVIVEEVVEVPNDCFKIDADYESLYVSNYELTKRGEEYFENTPLTKDDETLLCINDMQGKIIAEW